MKYECLPIIFQVKLLHDRKSSTTLSPPYIAEDDPHLYRSDLRFEPRGALVGGSDGLSHLRRIVRQAPNHLDRGGTLLVEHGYDQAEPVRALFRGAKFESIETLSDLASLPRVTLGQWA